MIGAVIGLVFMCVILGVVVWAGQQLMALIPIAEPFATIIRVLLVIISVIIVLYIISVLLGLAGINVPYVGTIR